MAARRPYLLIVLPLVLAACGGGGGGGSTGGNGSLDDAVKHTLAQKGEMVSVSAKVDLSGQTIRSTGDGAFDGDRGHLHLNFDVPLLGSSTLDEVVVGKLLWIKSPLIGKKWLRFEAGKDATVAGINLSALTGVTPTTALKVLQDGKATSLGNGHYRVAPGDTQYKSAEAWVDQQNLVRKVKLEIEPNVSSGGDKAHVTLTINYANFGTTVTATPPPDSEVSG